MVACLPQFWLTVRATAHSEREGAWHFALESVPGEVLIEAEDDDQGDIHRLHLIALVRGLEAVDGPAHVGLWTTNSYLVRGLQFELPQWREQGFQWEQHGLWRPIRHRELWQRVDRALQIHEVELCRLQVANLSPTRGGTAAARLRPETSADVARLGQVALPTVVHERLRQRLTTAVA